MYCMLLGDINIECLLLFDVMYAIDCVSLALQGEERRGGGEKRREVEERKRRRGEKVIY